MPKPNRSVIFSLCGIAGFSGWIVLTTLFRQVPTRYGVDVDPASQSPHIGLIAVGYLMTLIGAMLGSAFREIQAVRQRGETRIAPRQFFSGIFSTTDFWVSVLASPIAFALIWKTLDQNNVVSLVIVAIQNGLFCTVLASSFMAQPNERNINAAALDNTTPATTPDNTAKPARPVQNPGVL